MDKYAIIGKIGTGKTTLAKYILDNIYNQNGFICSFASQIKQINEDRSLLGLYKFPGTEIPLLESKFYTILHNLDNELQFGEKPRKQYQFIGEQFKQFYGQDFWVKNLMSELNSVLKIKKALNEIPEVIIIDDLRMIVEYNELKKQNYKIIGIYVPDEIRFKIIESDKTSKLESLNHNTETQVEDVYNDILANFPENQYEFESGKRIVMNFTPTKSFEKHLITFFKDK